MKDRTLGKLAWLQLQFAWLFCFSGMTLESDFSASGSILAAAPYPLA